MNQVHFTFKAYMEVIISLYFCKFNCNNLLFGFCCIKGQIGESKKSAAVLGLTKGFSTHPAASFCLLYLFSQRQKTF